MQAPHVADLTDVRSNADRRNSVQKLTPVCHALSEEIVYGERVYPMEIPFAIRNQLRSRVRTIAP
jgi:hypothetical protein